MTIRVCVGTEPKMRIPFLVLKHSILSRTDEDVQFFDMSEDDFAFPIEGKTGFSFRRWVIPEAIGYKGRAIYLDADQIVLTDIKELWEKPDQDPFPGNVVWCAKKRVPMLSVMVLDCEAAADSRWWNHNYLASQIRKGEWSKQEVMRGNRMDPKPRTFEYAWNHIDHFEAGVTKLLHFSDLKRQPWFQPEHPLQKHWEIELQAAIDAGAVTQEDIAWARGIYRKKEGLHPYYDKFLTPSSEENR